MDLISTLMVNQLLLYLNATCARLKPSLFRTNINTFELFTIFKQPILIAYYIFLHLLFPPGLLLLLRLADEEDEEEAEE